MDTWRETLAASITRPEDLAKHLDVDPEAIKDVVGEYPMRITPMWLKLIKEKGDAIWRQVVPEPEEMADESADDPLHRSEERRVGKECKSRRSRQAYTIKKKRNAK